MMGEPSIAAELGERLRSRAGRRIPGHQPAAVARSCLALKPDGAGLTVVGDDAQSIYSFRAATVRNILDFPGHFIARRRDRHARPQLSLDAADPRGGQCGDRAGAERFTKNLWTERQVCGQKPQLVTVTRRGRPGALCGRARARSREGGMALKAQAVLFRTSSHSGPLEIELTRRNIPFVKFGGLKFLDAAHVKDMLAVLRFAENPRDRVAGFRVAAIAARHRPRLGRQACSTQMAAAPQPLLALAETEPPPRAASAWPDSRRADAAARRRQGRLAGRARAGPALVRAAGRADPRGLGHPRRRICCSCSRSPRAIRAANASSPS